MSPGIVQQAKEREGRLASIIVLNENVEKLHVIVTTQGAEIRKDVNDLKAKVDEALLIGAAIKGTFSLIAKSVKMASQALVVLAVVALLFTISHSATVELVIHAGLEWAKHAIL